MWEVSDEHIIALSKSREPHRLSYEVWVKQDDDEAKLVVAYIAGREVVRRPAAKTLLPAEAPPRRESKARARRRLCRIPGIIMGNKIKSPEGDRYWAITQ